ncbi:restriction endonuclease subunit S [Pseudazoarcus pumilus]|uniref:Type I restriction endonuclease subunit S n=1 Tax=Pseudazoarcus pumilus TaxID=2067960 RepID=A0A2I6S4F3_9RHOO|nr:restriction endonuclease subunit S [Pseudazoarcus pumilus]AUN94143.1 type I restriction endonuclease subunit S [Pseudazoarcus pumilus]
MAASLPTGTTLARGLPALEQIYWPLVAARDLFQLRYGKALVETSRRPGSVPVYGTNGRCGTHDSALFKGPGVVLGRKGQGPLGVEWSADDYWVIDTAYSLLPLRADIDLRHGYFLIKYVGLNHLKDGTSNPTLSRDSFGAQAFPLPPLEQQRAIAHILGTLDDKIELNRRRNETLEAMARALLKDWFVDFGPVRAKMEGREPYLPADLWELFPGRFDDEGKPEGWDMRPLDEIANFLNGLALQKFPAADPDQSLPVIKIAELRSGISRKSDRASRDVPEKYVIRDGDFLFSWSGSLMAKFWTEGEGALNQHLFKVTSDRYPMWFVSHWVYQHLAAFQAIAASKATTMGHIQRGHLKAAMTVCPPGDALERMGVMVEPLVDQAIRNELESRSLAQIRDTLLPKLISGELRIKDAEKFIEEPAL